MYAKSIWYVDGLRWIGTILNDAADHLERNATIPLELLPRYHAPEYRAMDEYLSETRNRVHMHF